MVARHHVLIKCSDATRSTFVIVQYVPEVDVDARAPAFRLGHAVVPLLLRPTLHHEHIAVDQLETSLGNVRADPSEWRACARPYVCHVPHLEVGSGTEGQRRDDGLWAEECPAVSVPGYLVVAVEV